MSPGQLHDRHHELHGLYVLVEHLLYGHELYNANSGLNQVKEQRKRRTNVFPRQPIQILKQEVRPFGNAASLDQSKKRCQGMPVWIHTVLACEATDAPVAQRE